MYDAEQYKAKIAANRNLLSLLIMGHAQFVPVESLEKPIILDEPYEFKQPRRTYEPRNG